MIQPHELKLNLTMEVGNGEISTTTKVWEILTASHAGNLSLVKDLVAECPGLIYAQYNYVPPIHFAVREGHFYLVKYLLDNGAHDPDYRFYPFQESLQTVATDRGYYEITALLSDYADDRTRHKFKGDNGRIFYDRTPLQTEFEKAVDQNNLLRVAGILKQHPEYVLDKTYFWSEGILTMPAKGNHLEMIDLLMDYGAKVPDILKWAPQYYFEHYDTAEYMMEKGMSPNVMSWQRVTLLHNMAQKGFLEKAALLIKHDADINLIDDAYQSTPLGIAARWGQTEMVKYLLQNGANPDLSGAKWSTPLAWAQKREHKEIEKLLLKAGASYS